MITPTPEALALATAARLAHALDPDGWARCGAMYPHGPGVQRCGLCRGHGDFHDTYPNSDHGDLWSEDVDPLPPTLAAAQAEWAAAGGDPERGPALSGSSERVEWRVHSTGAGLAVHLRVGRFHGVRHYAWGEWHVQTAGDHGPVADIIELGRLAEAADGGAR